MTDVEGHNERSCFCNIQAVMNQRRKRQVEVSVHRCGKTRRSTVPPGNYGRSSGSLRRLSHHGGREALLPPLVQRHKDKLTHFADLTLKKTVDFAVFVSVRANGSAESHCIDCWWLLVFPLCLFLTAKTLSINTNEFHRTNRSVRPALVGFPVLASVWAPRVRDS